MELIALSVSHGRPCTGVFAAQAIEQLADFGALHKAVVGIQAAPEAAESRPIA